MTLSPFVREMIYWIVVALCLVGEAAILRSTRRAARGARAGAVGISAGHPPSGRPLSEAIWALLPPTALALLLTLAYGALRS